MRERSDRWRTVLVFKGVSGQKTNGFSVSESSWFSSCFERRQGLIFTSLSYRNWKCYSFLSNRFERFRRIKSDKPTQRLAFPTFQIKATQTAVISPWSKNCNVLPPNSPIDSTAEAIYLGRIIPAFEPGLHHITSSCKFWKWHMFKIKQRYTRLSKNNERRFRQSTAVATMQPHQVTYHSHMFRFRSACGSQIEKNNNLNSCKLRWKSFETNG